MTIKWPPPPKKIPKVKNKTTIETFEGLLGKIKNMTDNILIKNLSPRAKEAKHPSLLNDHLK